MGALTDIVRSSRTLEPQSRAAYLKCVQRFEAFQPNPSLWSAMTVERWRDALSKQGLKPPTVNKHLYALRYASKRREALGQGHDFARVAEAVKTYRVKKRGALTIDLIERILETCTSKNPRDIRDRAVIIVGIKTGLRVSELRQLEWAGISGRKAVVKMKGGHQHVAILDDECLAALTAWKKALGPKPPKAVFVAISTLLAHDRPITGRQLSRQALHRIVSERGKQAGIKTPVYPHLLRHTFVTWALEAGVPVQRVMVMTGHRSLQTLSGYVSDLQAESDPVGAYLPKLGGKK